jgi:hypothetical protein
MDEFVTYEIAEKLEEIGFEVRDISNICIVKKSLSADDHYIVPPETYATTIPVVLKWLRDEKKIFVEIALCPEGYRYLIYTGLHCTNTASTFSYSFDKFYNHENNYITFELAALAEIEYTIDNLI